MNFFINWRRKKKINLQLLQTMYAYICLVYQTFSSFLSPPSRLKVHVNSVIVLPNCNSKWTLGLVLRPMTTCDPVCFLLFFFFQFICNSTSTMRVACMDTMNLCGEAMYKGFYYISLIKAGLYSPFRLWLICPLYM